MSTLLSPEDTFLDNGKYDKFLDEVKNSLTLFLQEFNEYNNEVHELTNQIKSYFNSKNFIAIDELLLKHRVAMNEFPSYSELKINM